MGSREDKYGLSSVEKQRILIRVLFFEIAERLFQNLLPSCLEESFIYEFANEF